VFGTAKDPDIDVIIRSDFLKEFQTKFIKHYYTQYGDKIFEGNTNLQFYDEGCQIKLHDDGKPISRICVFLFFLNSEWNDENGGNLILYTKDNKQIKLKPTFPNFVVLDSDINLYHEVELVKSDTKYNIVSFYSYKD
jgi:Rps23 Pro-64 3,4-dihydroxylase Tpa1-like proline 4-hydroxylase